MQYLRLVGWALLLVGLIATPLFAGNTERVSIAGPAHTGSGTSRVPAITADARYVAFDSAAADLAPGDGNASIDVFIYDRTTGQMELVSTTTSDTSGNGESRMPSVSAYGRYVVFHSLADNLVTGDSNGVADCFLRDRQSGYTTRISVSSADVQGNGVSGTPQISADGRYVVFTSLATNLVGGDTNAVADIFVRDTQASVTTRVSLGASDAEANGLSSQPTVSGDGRYIAFYSMATNLVSGDSNGYADVFVRDTQTGITSRVSVATGGAQATGGASNAPALSTDGRWVAFVSSATNLVSGDTNGVADVFLRDLQTGTTTRVSVDGSGMQAGGASSVPSLSADGRYVTFTSTATNLVSGDANGYADVFVHDCQTGATWRASVTGAGGEATGGGSSTSAISADGGVVAFSSEAANLAVLDGNAVDDIFVHETASGETTTVSLARVEANSSSMFLSISADGRYVGFASEATNLVADDTNGLSDVFVHDRETGETTRVSVDSDGAQATGGGSIAPPAISADGRYVAFTSAATNLVSGDTNGKLDAFVHDCTTGETTRVSVETGGHESAGANELLPAMTLSISTDGRYVAFASDAPDLVADDTNANWDMFVHDRETVETTRVSLTSGGAQATGGMSALPSLSADARYVAFVSEATNLASGDTNEGTDVFLRDRQTGTTTLVDVNSEGVQAASGASLPAVSADGRYVGFISNAANLVTGDTNGQVDVFVRDVVLGTTERVSVATGGAQGDDDSLWLALSADGRRVAFASYATNLVADDSNGVGDIFLHDRATGVTTRVSVTANGGQGTGESNWVSLSADGKWVAFGSTATDLVPDDANGYTDVFVRERVTASFSGDPLAGMVPVTTTFTDLSTGGPTAWEWDFGDHTASSLQNPSHQYALPNRYTVALTVHDEVDQDTAFEPRYVQVSFTDVPLDQWAVNSILACLEAGIVTGYADLTYQPANAVTRDQMAVYIARALAEGDANVPAVAHAATFADVPSDYWAFKYVEYCYGASVVTGYWDGYHPTEIVNRAQMAVYVARSIVDPTGESGLTIYTPPLSASFPDVATDYWAYKHIEYCKAQGIVSGYWDGYHPDGTVTRDQMAVYVARAFGLPM